MRNAFAMRALSQTYGVATSAYGVHVHMYSSRCLTILLCLCACVCMHDLDIFAGTIRTTKETSFTALPLSVSKVLAPSQP